MDLHAARNNERKAKNPRAPVYTRADLIDDLDKQFGRDSVRRGKDVFAQTCARCHSSIPEKIGGPFANRDFHAVNEKHPRRVRADFLGNDESTPATEVGTFRCRALHSNHMAGRLYYEYGSDTLRSRKAVLDIPEQEAFKNGGRGYLRNVSLVNAWATAPFMHNNAIGPELCGNPQNKKNDFTRARYVDEQGQLLAQQPACFAYDASVEGRFKLYVQAMYELLNPKTRGIKMTLTTDDIVVDLGLRRWDGKEERALFGSGQMRIPQGTSAGFIGGLLHKNLIGDLYFAKRDPTLLEATGKKALVPELQSIADELRKDPGQFVDVLKRKRAFLQANYQTCMQEVENDGHRFGEDLSDADKKALIAFMATL
jgi:hypothetical protein